MFLLEWIEWNRVERATVSAIIVAPCDALKILVVPLSLADRGGGREKMWCCGLSLRSLADRGGRGRG